MAGETEVFRVLKLDSGKLAGNDLAAQEPFMDPGDVLEGAHQPRGEILHFGDQLVVEVYEDDSATFRFDEPFHYDEYARILSGELILTGSDGDVQEFITGDSFVVPKGWTGTWQMIGPYREIIVIERKAYEKAYGNPADW